MSKTKYKISNWKQYNQALINRGSVTFWVDEAAIQSWHCKEHHGKRGRGFTFTDGAIETALMIKGIKPTIPPRSNAGYWEDGHPRNEAVSALKSGHLEEWKRETDYHQRSLSETGMYRYKKLLSPQLALRDYDAQVGEALTNVKAMNKVIRLGMPVSYRVE
ncbi:transposase [Vibrio fluvialis]|uniref:transposase n=1 Tax=Vibrio fluvialis TaxID=676 RepID=UPI00111CD40A|nr:transposase [Vibrio fluvialis]TOY93627.1 hypothetical protein DJ016_09625 [Vibrio fluvialis]TRN12683.1 hypothetical protein DM587_08170 [Vibrio fluvialis]